MKHGKEGLKKAGILGPAIAAGMGMLVATSEAQDASKNTANPRPQIEASSGNARPEEVREIAAQIGISSQQQKLLAQVGVKFSARQNILCLHFPDHYLSLEGKSQPKAGAFLFMLSSTRVKDIEIHENGKIRILTSEGYNKEVFDAEGRPKGTQKVEIVEWHEYLPIIREKAPDKEPRLGTKRKR